MNDKLGLSCAKLRLDESVDTIEDTEGMESNQDYKDKKAKIVHKNQFGGWARNRQTCQPNG